ncbi:MAG: hypothetical protein UU10_C0022G0011 [Parcubacteria group bacterium GW2011_GWF1_40_6]|nr:MAG: hypothetical protein UU10_C0022G0011 [Parcubacteria group bacterium GW2011_GWF1_40_6]HLA29296.1 hypothetical protein [Syntrophales bacterium]
MKFYSKKVIELKNADIHLHYANNAGRGDNNVTVTVVNPGTPRPALTKFYTDNPNVIESYYVSGWRGNVNIPTDDIKKYGGVK